MSDHINFRKIESEKIINCFGVNFYNKVLKDIKLYADKWSLGNFEFIPSYSTKAVFKCKSDQFGEVVLKIGDPSLEEIEKEYHTLCQYDGKNFCEVFEADVDNGVILESCVKPGISLREEKSLEKRLSLFCSIYRGLHIPPINIELYPTYIGWVNRITDYMSNRNDCRELYLQMKKAEDICEEISALYSKKLLLHGDLHHDNILLGVDGRYVMIDPKGVIGDPIFDLPRFILNEFDDDIDRETYSKIIRIIGFLEKELDVPALVLRKCLYIETIMSVCWGVEDGEEYTVVKERLDLAEAILGGFC